MARRNAKKPEYLKHPFTRDKLRVLDSFEPRAFVACPACHDEVAEIKVVESESPGGIRYHVLLCQMCDQPQWVVLHD